MRPVSRSCFALLLLFVFLASQHARAAAPAAPMIPVSIGNAVVALNGPWRFHPGDDLAWAQPDYDDSGWTTMDLSTPAESMDPLTGLGGFVTGWTAKGYPRLTGFAWYRIRLNVSTSALQGERLAIRMPLDVDDAYQVYVNGQYLGEFGHFAADGVSYINAQPRSFTLPDSIHGGPVTIALRFWMDAATPLVAMDAGGPHGTPLLGQAQAIGAMMRLSWDDVDRAQTRYLIIIPLLVLMALMGVILYSVDRAEKSYLWLALACMVDMFVYFLTTIGYYVTWMSMPAEFFVTDVVLTPLVFGLWAIFWGYWFGLTEMRRIHRIAWSMVALLILGMAPLRAPLYGHLVPVSISSWLLPLTIVLRLGFGALIVWIVYRGIRLRGVEGWLGVPAVLLMPLWLYSDELTTLHLMRSADFLGIVITPNTVALLLMLTAILVLMLRRFLRGMRERELMKQEMEQARQVQQVLIPEALPRVAGFEIESEYKPARQVGGDFFQIIPLDRGGVLLCIGDVSGKGMPAAMTVSLLVGTLRSEARHTQSPAALLSAMNTRMLGRSQGGFTTCLIVRVDADGTVTAANAGHLAPYLGGRELAVANGLPLGLSATASYGETVLQQAAGERLTLITDGVVEARSRSGELFGFERAAAIAGQAAGDIARAGEQFGQEDDITVLGVVRLAV